MCYRVRGDKPRGNLRPRAGRLTIYVIDVAGGEKNSAQMGGPVLSRSICAHESTGPLSFRCAPVSLWSTLWIGVADGILAMLRRAHRCDPPERTQVIVLTDWSGRSPQEVEDQVTYPLTVNLQGLPVSKRPLFFGGRVLHNLRHLRSNGTCTSPATCA